MLRVKQKESQKSSCSCSSSDSNINNTTSCCCTPKLEYPNSSDAKWVAGRLSTPVGNVLQVSTTLTRDDVLGAWKVRWGINRMNYKVDPGIYCVGSPDSNSPVLVTANYKMSFDSLRKELSGLDAWILVLDTKGINVWCAAGKGTFGTNEVISRIAKVNLSKLVSHRTIILPQLGAPGIIAHEIRKQSGFQVVFGPVRASDVKAFLNLEMKATSQMRKVKFTLIDRLVLTPVELVSTLKISFIVFGVLFVLNSIGFGHFGFTDLYAYIGTILVGSVITPVFLPWIPGRAFAFKGWLLGLLWSIAVVYLNGFSVTPTYGWINQAAYLLILPALSSYISMNFTGCSTFTSLSGVKREMKIAVPLLIISCGLGIVLMVSYNIIKIIT